mmetsp:Transcript_21348/g.32450  ORF Transcript_21348/g.32450 Transcript_21348/m.32450 type:complete len:93 (+) Transcript_21348:361-639(+)
MYTSDAEGLVDIILGILPVDVRCCMMEERDVDLEIAFVETVVEVEAVVEVEGRGRRAPDHEHLIKRHRGRAGVLVLDLDLVLVRMVNGEVVW